MFCVGLYCVVLQLPSRWLSSLPHSFYHLRPWQLFCFLSRHIKQDGWRLCRAHWEMKSLCRHLSTAQFGTKKKEKARCSSSSSLFGLKSTVTACKRVQDYQIFLPLQTHSLYWLIQIWKPQIGNKLQSFASLISLQVINKSIWWTIKSDNEERSNRCHSWMNIWDSEMNLWVVIKRLGAKMGG